MELCEKKIFRSCTNDEDLQEYLLECIKINDLYEIKSLLEEDRVNVNHFYQYPYYKTVLSIACQWYSDSVSPDCIKLLLNYGADPLLEDDGHKNAINYAAESSNAKLLELILENLKRETDYNFENSTVMFSLIKQIKHEIDYGEKNRKEADYIDIIKILLEHGIDINKANEDNGETAIYIAAHYGFKDLVGTILKNGQVNLDKYKNKRTNKTARDLISEKQLFDAELPEYWNENDNTTVETLFKNIRETNAVDFQKNFIKIQSNLINQEDKNKLLHRAAEEGLDECVKFLLDKGADSNRGGNETLLEKACDNGYYKIVKLLIRKNPNAKTVANALLVLMKVRDTNNLTENINFNKCLDILLQYKDLKINFRDTLTRKTALHLAAKYQPSEMTLKILRKGASLACPDKFNVQPIADIDADTLKIHLDECIKVSQNCSKNDENMNLTIKVTSLLPPRANSGYVENEQNCKLVANIENQPLVVEPMNLLQETTVLQYMSKSQELKHLLKHPVIMTFLFLKWYCIRSFFYINLGVYITFCISLLTYIMLGYNNTTQAELVSYVTLLITCALLLFRELGQIVIYKLRYFKTFENWLEIILIIVTIIILIPQYEESTIRQLSAVAIVLSAIELLLLIGKFPCLSTNIMMLRTVSYTFSKLLLWYSILLFAFAFSFYTLFQKGTDQKDGNSKNEATFFLDPGMSLLKTIIMLTGEFDADSIKFSSYPITSPLIFVAFVFLIAIILFNLMNGLAVNDTQIIKNDAELYDQILRVEHIAHLEKVLLKNKILHWFLDIKKIYLFPSNILQTEIKIYVNQMYKIIYGENDEIGQNKCYQYQEIDFGRKIQRAIKNQLQEKHDEEIRKSREDEISRQLKSMKEQLDILQTLLANKQ